MALEFRSLRGRGLLPPASRSPLPTGPTAMLRACPGATATTLRACPLATAAPAAPTLGCLGLARVLPCRAPCPAAQHPGARRVPAPPLHAAAGGDASSSQQGPGEQGPGASGGAEGQGPQQQPGEQQQQQQQAAGAEGQGGAGLEEWEEELEGGPAEPWSPDFIRSLLEREQEWQELVTGEQWVGSFRDDPESLYYYLDDAYEEGPRRVLSPEALLAEEESGDPVLAWPAAVANDIVGMGTWRLKGSLDPIIEFLVPRIEGNWRELLDTDLNLYPRDRWKAQGWDLVDSEDPKRELDGYSIFDIPDPQEGAQGYPRLTLENRVYCSRVFRKLHVEVGVRQDGLHVLHVVLYPRYNFDLPIFGLDMVVVKGRVSLAVCDLMSLRPDRRLPAHYMETMAVLQQSFFEGCDMSDRRVPDWGKAIFSPLAVCITPKTPEELAGFVKYAVALHRAHLLYCRAAEPIVVAPGRADSWSKEKKLRELLDGQKRFCDNQLANVKTRRVLEAAFGAEWTNEYMGKMMFDYDPTYNPPYYDASFEKLYEYFQDNHEYGELAAEAADLEMAAKADRATETLQDAAEGRVSREKLALAMEFMFDSDPTFRAAVEALVPELREGKKSPREFMTDELMELLVNPERGLYKAAQQAEKDLAAQKAKAAAQK